MKKKIYIDISAAKSGFCEAVWGCVCGLGGWGFLNKSLMQSPQKPVGQHLTKNVSNVLLKLSQIQTGFFLSTCDTTKTVKLCTHSGNSEVRRGAVFLPFNGSEKAAALPAVHSSALVSEKKNRREQR